MKKKIALILLIVYLAGCVSRPSVTSRSSNPSPSNSDLDEIALGRQINESIVSKMPVYQDPTVSGYISELGKKLARFAKRQELPYHFVILQDDRIYATSAPGGFVYITTGFILFVENEAELAAILAHEIGQLQFKDYRLSRARKILEKLIASGAAIAPVFGNIGALALIGVVSIYALTDRNSKDDRRLRQVDKAALQLLANAGEDPQGLANMLYKVLNATPKELMYLYDYYQTRPVTEVRLKKLEHAFSFLPLEGKSFNTNRTHFLQMTQPLRTLATT